MSETAGAILIELARAPVGEHAGEQPSDPLHQRGTELLRYLRAKLLVDLRPRRCMIEVAESGERRRQSAVFQRAGGTLAPMAGYKGVGLAVVLGMMTSFLAGSMFDDQKRDPVTKAYRSGTTGHMFQVYDIAAFTDLEEFCQQVRDARSRIQASPPREGVDKVYAPGDIENAKSKAHLQGVPLEQFTLDDLAWVAEFTGVEYNIV